jgi:protein-S-isoprenylcysteine O-methyltransferase Ste14
METPTIFRILLPILLLAFAVHRGYYVRKHGQEGLASKLAGILGLIGFLALLVYVLRPDWLAWASLPFPMWLRWSGVGLALAGFGLVRWAQNTPGENWSDRPRMQQEQSLVTEGPYRFIRHPIYTAFLLILGSTLFISADWLIGIVWLGMTALEVASRIQFEEDLMLGYFGHSYRDDQKHTGKLFPTFMEAHNSLPQRKNS